MKIATFTSTLPTMGDTRTYENYINYLSVHPEDLGVVSRMYEELTAPYLTEALGNIFYKDTTKRKYESINTLAFDWEIEVNQIKRIEFAAVPEGDGKNQTEIIVAFRERYYDKYDTFKIDGSGLTCIVLSDPNRKADKLQ